MSNSKPRYPISYFSQCNAMQGKQDRIGVFRFLSEWYAQWQQVSAVEFERRRQQVFLGLSAQTQE
jgi:hypothetical protein